jgi:hypothetical protein
MIRTLLLATCLIAVGSPVGTNSLSTDEIGVLRAEAKNQAWEKRRQSCLNGSDDSTDCDYFRTAKPLPRWFLNKQHQQAGAIRRKFNLRPPAESAPATAGTDQR